MEILKEELYKFGKTTSIRGIPRVLNTSNYILKISWLIVFLATTGIFIWQMVLLVSKYYTWPIVTNYGESRQDFSLTFPDVIICNPIPNMDFDAFDTLTNTDEKFMNILGLLNNTASQSKLYAAINKLVDFNSTQTTSMADYLRTMWYNINLVSAMKQFDKDARALSSSTFILDCALFGLDWNDNGDNCRNYISELETKSFEVCYQIKLPDKLKSNLRGISLILFLPRKQNYNLAYENDLTQSLFDGVRLSIQDPNTMYVNKNNLLIASGFETTVRITETDRTRLNTPYGTCNTGLYLDHTNNTYRYSYDACVELCIQAKIISQCNCISPTYNNFDETSAYKLDLCGIVNLEDIQNSSILFYDKKLGELVCFQLYSALNFSEDCSMQCQLGCKERLYEPSVTSVPWPTLLVQQDLYKQKIAPMINSNPTLFKTFVSFQKDSRITNEKQLALHENSAKINLIMQSNKPYILEDKPMYTGDNMLSLIGGCFSLWMGITVLTGMEIIEVFYFFILHVIKKCNTLKTTSKKETPTDLVANWVKSEI